MPPRSGALTSSFSTTDSANEVVCPLRNNDGSSCRKRCLGEKRYRSMQEHIRRAHPEHYISKLPATEESFALMINTPPSEKPPPQQQQQQQLPQPPTTAPRPFAHDRRVFYDNRSTSPATPRASDEYHSHSLLPAASAAAALAQLHNHRPESDWESEPETSYSDNEAHRNRIASSIELPPINNIGQDRMFPGQHFDPTRPRQLLPSILSRSPPGRSSTLPPLHRPPVKPNRPRKSSITQNARKPRHEKKSSREHIRRQSYDRKAFSAEPSGAVLGKRWEDLIDAAASATEEPTDEDRTPVPPSPPMHPHRASLPPFPASQPHFASYQASPLQHALTPPSYSQDSSGIGGPEPFPSVESSGENFHIGSRGLEGSVSPAPPHLHAHHGPVEIYCAACRRLSILRESYACTECICGVCRDCLDALTAPMATSMTGGGLGATRPCPKCNAIGGRWKPFQLDFR